MKWGIWKRLLCIGFTAALTMGLFGGCGKEKKVDYEIEGVTETKQPQSEEGRSGLAQFEEGEVWKEALTSKTIKTKWDGEKVEVAVDVQVNAEITIPQVKQMSVVEVAEPEFDAAFKETVAENIFDSGEVYYGDVNHLTKKDLQELEEYWSRERTMVIKDPIDAEGLVEYITELWDAIDKIEAAGDTYIPVEEYTVDEYLGTYKGRMYGLTFSEYQGSGYYGFNRLKRIICKVKDLSEVCPEEFKDTADLTCYPWMRGNWAENQCEISEEEAMKSAKAFAERLGLDYPVLSYTRPLVWGTLPENTSSAGMVELGDWEINGYVFYFDLGVDELSFVSYGTEADYRFSQSNKNSKEKQYSLKAQMQVYVTDQGVIQIIADNPMEITGLSEGVELLPLDTIKSIIKEALEEQCEVFRLETSVTDYDGMELIYFRVRDKENPGKYSYVPTWRLGNVTKDSVLNQIVIKNQILINAIDGSVIDFYDET